ncbi:MAG TPA: DNA repair protein RadA [Thiotrichaceae bacterium]|jgi:DNA repair protein RadA/Sms|nr:DNA repair protein RadA [Thiotrichaceae bacterium]HIM08468.1 DNA repair protein RadA [Gammaproteobacteria bacterium]
MAKAKLLYQCNECGGETPKWVGQCPDCMAWNTLEEIVVERKSSANTDRFHEHLAGPVEVCSLGSVDTSETPRQQTGLAELDRVMGGGLVTGSVTLIGGDPGIGKSTLLLQTLSSLDSASGVPSLYVTGEESTQQVGLRGQRLGLPLDALRILTENHLERILSVANKEKAKIIVIDSIQTVYSDVLQSAPGSVAQVRECAAQLVRFAKQTNTSLFLIGHVTKEGALAGPRVLEHMVDTVLYFEGDSSSRYRVVRAVKNRYGAVNELGIFAMTEKGLKEVSNPSAIFLSRHDDQVSGSSIMVTREGTRPMLVEVQALVDQSQLGNPRRVAVGLEQNRLAMLLAVLHRHAGISMSDQDVFINVVGGMRISETASDLPLLLAIVSSFKDRPLPNDMIMFGEIGLSGEIRPIQNGIERLNEAVKHGFKQALVPKANSPKGGLPNLDIQTVTHISQVMEKVGL